MPIYFRKMVLLAKIETTYATDPTLTGTANAVLAKNVSISDMEGNDVSRDLVQPTFGNQPSLPADVHVTLEFDTELAGSGVAGTAPAWGPLFRGAGCAEVILAATSVTYSPITDAVESVYLKFWMGSTLHALKGARGTGKLNYNAQGIPFVHWKFWGLYTPPSEVAAATPVFTAWKKPLIVNKVNTQFTVNSVALVTRSFSLDLANPVEPRLLINSESIQLTDHREQIEFTAEAVPVSGAGSIDLHGLATTAATVPVTLTHGATAGNILTLSAPTAQFQRPGGYSNSQGIAERGLKMLPLPNAGNDQWSLVAT
jgi:hypothetical protein